MIAGVLASVGDDYLVTDDSWKCTTGYYDDWMQTSFDDSSWPAAVIVQPNSPANPYHHLLSAVSTSASWIWTSNFISPNIDPVAYCRGYMRTFVLYTVARKMRRWSLLGRHRNPTQDNARHRTAPRYAAWRRMYRVGQKNPDCFQT